MYLGNDIPYYATKKTAAPARFYEKMYKNFKIILQHTTIIIIIIIFTLRSSFQNHFFYLAPCSLHQKSFIFSLDALLLYYKIILLCKNTAPPPH